MQKGKKQELDEVTKTGEEQSMWVSLDVSELPFRPWWIYHLTPVDGPLAIAS
ncbi:hypothetical protein ACWEO2_28500 [Nocardia sp. NPDC004278]